MAAVCAENKRRRELYRAESMELIERRQRAPPPTTSAAAALETSEVPCGPDGKPLTGLKLALHQKKQEAAPAAAPALAPEAPPQQTGAPPPSAAAGMLPPPPINDMPHPPPPMMADMSLPPRDEASLPWTRETVQGAKKAEVLQFLQANCVRTCLYRQYEVGQLQC